MKIVRCISNDGHYWYDPYTRISKLIEKGRDYEVRDEAYYSNVYKWNGRTRVVWTKKYLIATPIGSLNLPARWFRTIQAGPRRKLARF